MEKIRMALKQLSCFGKPHPYPLEKPVVIQFPVIDICNSQCQMCRIWENKKSACISPEELRKGLRNPLYSEVSAVGINGGEPTLRKDLWKLATVLFEELPRLRTISLITNAYNSDEVIARISEVGAVVERCGGTLDVMVSLDGVGDVHDRVRGKPGNFERAVKVIDYLQSSPSMSNLRIGCTIIRENVFGLADLLEFCLAKGIYIKYRLGIPHKRLYTENLKDPYAITDQERYHIAEFLEGLIIHYETGEHQKFFYRSLIDQLIHGAPRKAGCDWQHRGVTITSKGELLYCAVQSKVLGKIHEMDSEYAYFGNKDHLQDIIKTKCASCNHDYVGIPHKRQYFKQLAMQTMRKLRAEPLARRLFISFGLAGFRNYSRFKSRLALMRGLTSGQLPIPIKKGAKRQVLICGWYGTETLGDKAILGGVMHVILKTLGEVDFTLVSLFPYVSEMSRRQMDELEDCRIVSPQEGVLLAASMDLVVFGGGPLMAIDELADMEAIFRAAKIGGVPTMIAGCGVGPLGAKWYTDSLRDVLSLASLRIFRDEASRALAGKLGLDVSADLVAEDPAFTWLHGQRDRLQGRSPSDHKVLLLGLRDFPWSSYARHLSSAESQVAKLRYEQAVLQALENLVDQNPDLVIRPLPMCTNHYGDDDRWFYRRLFRGNARLVDRLDSSLLSAELTPVEYCEAFRSAHVTLAMRFHSMVFALGLDIPAVAIDYTLGKGKVRALAERFDVPCQNLAELDADFIVREVNKLFMNPRPQAQGFVPEFADVVSSSLPALFRSGQSLQAP
jgi:polysaccharide pyruvyl transferase WcaK-like protein/MoaA/NifB/PqqE/SkfB family radical SAM enzyme